jgi:hypothetical protein
MSPPFTLPSLSYIVGPTNHMGRIHMALNVANKNATQEQRSTTVSTNPVTVSNSFVSLTQAMLPTTLPLRIQCLLPASTQLSPYIEISSQNGTLLPYTTLSTRVNPLQFNDSNGHFHALLKLPFSKINNIQMMLGAWMTNDSIYHLLVHDQKSYNNNNSSSFYVDDSVSWNQLSPPRSPSTRNYSPTTVHLQGVMEYQESIVALHTELPLSVNSGYIPEHFDTLLWINLGGGSSNGDAGNDQQNSNHSLSSFSSSSSSSSSYPPLWLTLKQSTTRGHSSPHYTLNLSQILSFDRKCWNILEDRAPMIRNHIGWTFQIQQQQQPEKPSQHATSTFWSLAANWQINRHVAIKAVLDQNGNYLRTNMIFKTWQQPRMTLCILHGIDLTNGGKVGWLGCGWELETTTTATTTSTRNNHRNCNSNSNTNLESAGYHETANLERINVPPTKIQVKTVPPPSPSHQR